jgi:hypothetical protein
MKVAEHVLSNMGRTIQITTWLLVLVLTIHVKIRRGKSGGIWASSAQKNLRLQKDYAKKTICFWKFVEKYCHRRISAAGRRNSFSMIL